MDWFRFYSETIRDPKIRRVARKTKQPAAQVIGVWSVLLSIASESPERGKLLIGNDPVTAEDIEDVTDCNVTETLREMLQIGLLELDGDVLTVAAWGKRQYSSDNSTSRVQKHRKNKTGNVTETLHDRFSNAPDTDTDTEVETAADFSSVQDRMITQWRAVLGDTLTPAIFPEVRPYMVKLHERGLDDWWILALQETTGARRPGWQYMKAILEGWLAAGKPSVNGTGSETPKARPSYDNPEALERSRRIEEAARELAKQGVTQETDHLWMVKLDDLVEAKYGSRP